MESAHSDVTTDSATAERSLSLARRLLAGAGRASMLAYDLVPSVAAEALVHGLSGTGELTVACVERDDIPTTSWEQGQLRVRFDVVKEAPEWSVRITACAVHLLGVLEWLSEDAKARYLAGAGVPPRVAELASAPGGRLGIVRTERVLVHDSTGVTPFAFGDVVGPGCSGLRGSFPGVDDEWAAREVVGGLGPSAVEDMLEAAHAGWGAATRIAEGVIGGCPHTTRRVFCVDIDRTGLTLMEAEAGFTTVTVLAFPQAVGSVAELADGLHQLRASAAEYQRTS